jgi:hypothetical protein
VRPFRFIAVAFLAAATFAPSAAADPLSFMPPQYIDETFPGGEPVLQVDTVHHTIVYSSHEGTTHLYRNGLPSSETLSFFTEYRNQTKMWTSADNGATWERVDFNGTGFATDPTKNTGFSDPDFAQDESGRIYNTGINLANDALFSSGDGGKTWDKGTPYCSSADRPWLAGGKPDEAWMSVNANAGGHEIYHSTDGGNTCSTDAIPAEGGNGKIYYDHASERLVEPAQNGGKLGINVWKRGDAAFTFKPAVEANVYAHWPAIALDGAGTIYMVWDDNPRADGTSGGCNGAETPLGNNIRMVYSKDFGGTWSTPITIAHVETAFAFWPWIAAGDKGKVSIVWYQTDKIADVGCEPAKISIFAASVMNADDDAKRKVETIDAAGRSISDAEQICQNGTTCVATGQDRRLGDFFTNAIDERGCAIIASGDTNNPDPVTGGQRNVSLPLFIRQASGPRLIGEGDCSGKPQPVPGTPATPTTPGVTPTQAPAAGVPLPSARRCTSRRKFPIRLRAPKGQRLRSAKVYVDGKKVKVRKSKGRLTATVDLRGLKKSRYTVKVVAVTGQGRTVISQRRYRTCFPKRR